MDFFGYLYRFRIIQFIKKWNILPTLLGILDILAITLAFQFSYLVNYYKSGGVFLGDKNFLLLYLGILPFWLIILYLIKITEIPRTKRYRVLFFEYFQSALITGLLLMMVYFIFKMVWISRLFLIEFTFLGFLFLFIIRLLEYKVLKTYRAKGYNYINIALVVDDSSVEFVELLEKHKEWGYRIVAFFTDTRHFRRKYAKTIIIIPSKFIEVINDLMKGDIIDEVLYLKNRISAPEVRKIVRACEELGVIFRLRHNETDINLTNAIKTNIGFHEFLTFINIPHNTYSLAIKKILDINISLLMFFLLSPVLLTIAVLIKVTSSGPIIYKQTRVGLRGRLFELYKFRTMVVNADALKENLETANEMDGPVFKMKDDPRVTRVGKFLRKTGLDELPQLINILKGEMSLIGPRPPIPKETEQYESWQLRRLSIKPGLSCFWQIKPDRNNIKFEKWMELDLAYIDNWSLRLDFIILLKTIRTVFKRSGL